MIDGQMALTDPREPGDKARTKREVLTMLRQAGSRGVLSKELYARFLGRGAARIYDLKQDGFKIESVREGKYARYTLEEE